MPAWRCLTRADIELNSDDCMLTRLLNRVLDDAVEIDAKKQERKEVGRILLKGESITLLQEAQPVRAAEGH